jgi:hypothetical protein
MRNGIYCAVNVTWSTDLLDRGQAAAMAGASWGITTIGLSTDTVPSYLAPPKTIVHIHSVTVPSCAVGIS